MALFNKVLGALAVAVAAAGASSVAWAQTRGVTSDSVKIAQLIPLSGGARSSGIALKEGVQAYVKAVNKEGGINGRMIDLLVKDDGYNADKTKELTIKALEEDKVFGFVSTYGTAATAQMRPIVEQHKAIVVGPFTGAESVRGKTSPVIFYLRPSYNDETEKVVEHLTSFGIENIAVFYQNDGYGKAGLDGVSKALGKRRLKISGSVSIERGSLDVEAAVNELAKQNPEAIVMVVANNEAVGRFADLYSKKGQSAQLFNLSGISATGLAGSLGKLSYGMAFSGWVPDPSDVSIPVVAEYQKRMLAINPGFKPDPNSLEGYLNAKLMGEGLKKAGRDLTPESFQSAMESMKNYDLGGLRVTFGPDRHEGTNSVDLIMIGKKGQLVQ